MKYCKLVKHYDKKLGSKVTTLKPCDALLADKNAELVVTEHGTFCPFCKNQVK